MASIFVRDLHENVTESTLYQKFSLIGPLLSLRICREEVTNRSLGYAYINYIDRTHAKLAIETLNFELLEGKPIQVLLSERDPLLRRNHEPNVFVKNLDTSVTNRELYLAFSQFGNVVSSKVAKDQNGISKCYGFVQFEEEGAAMRSIFTLNGSMVKNKILCVQRFKKQEMNGHQLNAKNTPKKKFTNIYVKNIGSDVNDQGLHDLFAKFGKIISPKIMTNSDGTSRGFGFVSFEEPDAAHSAILAMNGYVLPDGRALFVSRAQKKKEREIALKTLQQENGHEMRGKLCVSNLDDTVDDDRLLKEFQPYGPIATAKVIMKEGRSIGIGCVSFIRSDDAVKAIAGMNGRIVGTKPVIVYLTDGVRSSVGEKRLSNARPRRPNWLEIVNSTSQPNGLGNDHNVAEQVAEKRKPDMALVYRMLSPPDAKETRILSFEHI